MSSLSVRIDRKQEKKIKYLMDKLKIADKSSFIRRLLEKSLTEELLDFLCEEIKNKHLTMWKASEIAGISLRSIMMELKKRKISLYDQSSLLEDLHYANRD